ncbi:selenocysteine-specific translation elongation factor [Roseateles saccharophilus]|uniref:Selenocysteine-specific elongation factor n=1 Tax=Roseateles saccharophilus TaxID=304 RepID=A0A4R3UAN5_ROSSA|nr:selenocysteine-specific translation elongation factor [Roseateles saccharophilus]MDG0835560.1 selenocysteine-specific translation elongation factor [Roseateles saccharophilus]TCU85474.1 selenocysteine-specific translation elongation factor SelB [Roseateles saccharophilus]
MIVGTAGHIDHGKTTLVRALTGVDTDRLPEEKARGISIELGYAYLDVPNHGERIGFIDVPGHEKLVHTMLAGASGIDFALLLVAADDGVMPQTREHLAVLSLLGITHGAVAITKADRAEPARIDALQDEVRALLAGTGLDAVPILVVSVSTGQGVHELRVLLFDAARHLPLRPLHGLAPRLAVDRAFTLDGVGTVVTGTLHAGEIAVGDELAIQGHRARVRSLHAQNQAVERAHAGQRCAVALAGLAREQAPRGQWLTAPHVALATERFDARIRLWPGEARPLRSGLRVHLHLGAQSVMASVAVLEGDAIEPGASARVQLVCHAPVGAWRGDRLVLRDAGATRTMAGGVVLDPFAPARYRRTPERLAELAACELPTAARRRERLLALSATGLDLARFAQAEGLAEPQQGWALGDDASAALTARLLAALADFHARSPDELGPDAARLRRLVAPRIAEPLWRELLAGLRATGRIGQRGAFVHLPEHGVQLSAVEQRIAQKIAPLLAAAGVEGAWARDLARDSAEAEPLMRATLARLAQQGELHQVVKDLFFSTATMAALAATVRRLAADGGVVTAGAFRDAAGLGRKRAIQVLEHFDRVGLLRRVGDEHRLRADSALFDGASN